MCDNQPQQPRRIGIYCISNAEPVKTLSERPVKVKKNNKQRKKNSPWLTVIRKLGSILFECLYLFFKADQLQSMQLHEDYCRSY